jgi:hypothetical protein
VQRLADIDVAEARDDPLVEQQRLDRRARPASARRSAGAVEVVAERLRPHARKRLVAPARGRHQVDRAEAARIVQRQPPPSSVSISRWSCGADLVRIDPPAAGHAEVEDQRVAAVGVDQAVFGARPSGR